MVVPILFLLDPGLPVVALAALLVLFRGIAQAVNVGLRSSSQVFWDKVRVGVGFWGISGGFLLLLREAGVDTNHHIHAGNKIVSDGCYRIYLDDLHLDGVMLEITEARGTSTTQVFARTRPRRWLGERDLWRVWRWFPIALPPPRKWLGSPRG